MQIETLDAAIRTVCPIDGLALLDRKTGSVRIDFSPAATPQQQAAAKSIASSFDWSAPEPRDTDRESLKTLARKLASDWTQSDLTTAVATLVNLASK